MNNQLKKITIFFVISLLILSSVIFILESSHSFFESTNAIKTFCINSQQNVEKCIQIYSPVCGWSDSKKIQCLKYPCAETFSNNCFAKR